MKMKLILAITAMLAFGTAQAKLAPPSDEAKAKAAEAKEKADHGGKVAAYQLCKSQNRTAERYMKEHGKKGAAPPACQDPGPFKPAAAPAAAPAPAPAAAAPAMKK
ncbi:MAG: hypothetical protein Q8L69_08735 [Gallionellaceae bacterium]|nr:hypothetical protein [Gallionellaceae bacterium]